MDKLRVAVIGVGHLGTKHAKVYSQLAERVNLVGVCDIIEEKATAAGREFNCPAFTDYAGLFGKADAVSICVPTLLHHKVAKDCLNHGLAVLVEKPFTTTLKEADGLVSLAERKNLTLQVGHVERFNSAFQAICALAKGPRFVECHRLNLFPNRSLDIGVVLDLMIHDIDIVLGLEGSEITDIQAVGVKVLTDFEDIANCRLTFKNGCVCNLTASRISEEVTRKIRIFTKDSYISLDYCKQEAFIYKKHQGIISKHHLPIEKEEPLKKEIESFINCVLFKEKPLVSGNEGRAALDLALRIQEKIWKAKK
ncbi:MAG: Gfo/Idh/MocA family oxidoreductase [Candidatus Omnitrophota bacterium]